MHKQKPVSWQSPPRNALRTVSNYQSKLAGGSSSSADPQKTPTQGISFAQRAKTESSKIFNHSVRRQLSRSHGDLSKLRPKSPPIYGLTADSSELRLFPGGFIDNTHTHSSPSHTRQSRRALPSDWTVNQAINQPREVPTSVNLSSYEASLPSTDAARGHALPVAIAIQGLSAGVSGPMDFCKPIVRTHSSFDPDKGHVLRAPAVQQIDVKTDWYFPDFAVAHELYRIHLAFTMTLERMLASELWKIYHQDCAPNYTEDEGSVRGISFCRDQLVGDMADFLYSTEDDIRVKARFGLIRLYLAANDCLVQYDGSPSRDTSITVRVSHDWTSQSLYPFVHAAWVPDAIIFKTPDGTQSFREGQELSVVPRYQCNSAFGLTRFPTNVRYSIESQLTPLSWLRWDNHIAGFRGTVPVYSAIPRDGYRRNLLTPTGSLCLDVLAVIVEDNGSSVRFERTLRARLTFDILPPDHYCGPSPQQCTGLDVTSYSLNGQVSDLITSSVDRFSVDTHALSQTGDGPKSIFSSDQNTASIPSSAKPGISAARLPDLAQKNTRLTGRYAYMSQRHADKEKHAGLFDSIGGYRMVQRQQQQPDLQIYDAGIHDFAPLASRPTLCQPLVSGLSAISDVSGYALNDIHHSWDSPSCPMTPQSPRLEGRTAVQDHVLEQRDQIRFPALPPPAVRSAPFQRYDEINQAWTLLSDSRVTPPHHEHGSGVDTNRVRRNTRYGHASMPGKEVRSLMGESRPDVGLAAVTQDPATPSTGNNDAARPVKSEQGSRKRHARSSLNNMSCSKRPKEDEDRSYTSISRPRIASYDSCYSSVHNYGDSMHDTYEAQEASFFDVPNSVERSEGDAIALMRSGSRSPHSCLDSGSQSDLRETESKTQSLALLNEPVQYPNSVPTPPDSLHSMSRTASEAVVREHKPWGCANEQQDRKSASNPYQIFFPNDLSVSAQSCASASSRTASSDLEITTEEPLVTVDRRQQANTWQRLSGSESSDKENKPETAEVETRLSEDEQKAIKEAIERSLNDITEDFNGIFINDSDEVASDDEASTSDKL